MKRKHKGSLLLTACYVGGTAVGVRIQNLWVALTFYGAGALTYLYYTKPEPKAKEKLEK